MSTKPVVLCILDGWGVSDNLIGNATALAKTPCFDKITREYPSSTLITHGVDVGLPPGQMGNSEVGHMNIGAGRIVQMQLGTINSSIENGTFFSNMAIRNFMDNLKKKGGSAHIMGLLSDGAVHGHFSHMIAAIKAMQANKIRCIVHIITDGRDVAPKSAKYFFNKLKPYLKNGTRVGTISGRFFSMDRDNRWDRIKIAYDAVVHGIAEISETDVLNAIEKSYLKVDSDEFIPATVIDGYKGLEDGDGFFVTNFRSDRIKEFLSALGQKNFARFEVDKRPKLSRLLGMVSISEAHDKFMMSCFPKKKIKNTLGSWVSKHNKKQFRLAETEKYPHVTYFLNGGHEKPYQEETRCMPHSPKVKTYDLKPEMSAKEVTEKFIGAISSKYDLIIANFANPDMVGHTGNLEATIKACETIDNCLKRIIKVLIANDGIMLLTSDHGNCEMMLDPFTGDRHTAHTVNPVPIILVNAELGLYLGDGGRLADIAPTLLELMELKIPSEMTGASLLRK